MAEQITWNNIEEGMELAPLPKIATTRMLIEWAGASGDFNPIHYDVPFSKAAGLDRPVVQGALKRQWLIQFVTTWMGDEGTLKKFSLKYRSMDYPRYMKTMTEPADGETWFCKGSVKKKYMNNDEATVDCTVWVENGSGEITTEGKATIVLPNPK
ncbi:MaoC/PaaZ C-terminal domain-containing protein [Chloroflexota bacterium]